MRRLVFDTGALVAAERGKARASRFLRSVHTGSSRLIIPLPVIAEWWRGRTDVREEILGASEIVGTLEIVQAAGVALARAKDVDARLTIDAIVMATAAMLDGIVVTHDPEDFARLGAHFPGVPVLSA